MEEKRIGLITKTLRARLRALIIILNLCMSHSLAIGLWLVYVKRHFAIFADFKM